MSSLKNLALLLKEKLEYSPKEVTIISAHSISHDIFEEVREVYGDSIVITQTIDPSIVGGIKLKIGDLLVDASVNTHISELNEAITSGESSSQSEEEFVSKLRETIEGFNMSAKVSEVGTVVSIKDGICKISGLKKCMYQEVLQFMNGTKALALNLEEKEIGAIILGDFSKIKQGDIVKRTGKVMSVSVGEEIIGHVINAIGDSVDGTKLPSFSEFYPIEKVAPGVMARKPVDQPLQTGIKAIDALIPIGRGQRELILGDRQTGKTTIAIDTIINQREENVVCIYVAIGQKESKLAKLVQKLREAGAMDYTIVVKASASESAPLLYLAPYTGIAVAEYFADKGKDVLIIYDDLSKHAVAYREMSLLLRRPPGREAFPGDVFYLHSRLLERACRLNEKNGGGSITALPIIETQSGDISAYIPTNVISITDGQIFLEGDLFYRGVRPAINVGLSVSRVGGSAQIKPMKKVAGPLKLSLAQFRELEAFSQFSSDLDPATKQQIDRGKRLTEILKQKPYSPVDVIDQIIVLFAVSNRFFNEFEFQKFAELEKEIISFVKTRKPEVVKSLKEKVWDEKVESELKEACQDFVDSKK